LVVAQAEIAVYRLRVMVIWLRVVRKCQIVSFGLVVACNAACLFCSMCNLQNIRDFTGSNQVWHQKWEKNILGGSRNRYCDKEMGEELGWRVSPFLNGFYYGCPATGDPKWVALGGYYGIDVQGMVAAFEHGLVFTRADLDRLVATNRDFIWNQQVEGARFQRLDGGQPDSRWRNSPGVLWTALVPCDQTLKRIFLANHNPANWGGLSATPWFLSL
jgi:hypothetical protein